MPDPAPAIPSFDAVLEILETAKEENQLSSLRAGQLVTLPATGEVWMTGDLHDNRTNLAKLVRLAALDEHPGRHLVLHELIHGDHFDANGAEDSWLTLLRCAELKCDYPGQVHFLLANHDLAQIHGEGIMKGGLSVCEAFHDGLKRDFPQHYHKLEVAISELLLSFPLAIKCPGNGLFFCHSLPTDKEAESFDYGAFDRELVGADYVRKTGPAYQLVWGRGMGEAAVNAFADKVGAKIVVTGHQPQESGFEVNTDRHLILASDHARGVFLPVELDGEYDMPTLVSRIRRFAAVSFEEDE